MADSGTGGCVGVGNAIAACEAFESRQAGWVEMELTPPRAH